MSYLTGSGKERKQSKSLENNASGRGSLSHKGGGENRGVGGGTSLETRRCEGPGGGARLVFSKNRVDLYSCG